MQGYPKNDCNWMELQSENDALEMDGLRYISVKYVKED